MTLHTNHAEDWHVVIVSDETVTQAEVLFENETFGEGMARRRPGETRNVQLGIALALQRAFRDAAKTCGVSVKALMPRD